MRVAVLVGTKGPFPRLVAAALAWVDAGTGAARADGAAPPVRRLWVQHADPGLALPPGVEGAALAPHAAVLAELAAADVVVCHAGSGAVRDALRLGHVPVVVPRRAALGEHVNDHQRELVEGLGDRIVACLSPEDPEAFARAIAAAAARRGEPANLPGDALRADVRAVVAAARPDARAPWVWSTVDLLTRPLRRWLRTP